MPIFECKCRDCGAQFEKIITSSSSSVLVGSVQAPMWTSYSLYSLWQRARAPLLLSRLAHAEHVARASGECAESSLASPADGQGEMGGVAGPEADERVRRKLDLLCEI